MLFFCFVFVFVFNFVFTWSCVVLVLDEMLLKLYFPSALLSTEVTLELGDSSVNCLVLVQVALVGELLSTIGALVVVDLVVHRPLVLLQVSGILGDVAAYVTNILLLRRLLHFSVLEVHPMTVPLVIFEVAPSHRLVAQLTGDIL